MKLAYIIIQTSSQKVLKLNNKICKLGLQTSEI